MAGFLTRACIFIGIIVLSQCKPMEEHLKDAAPVADDAIPMPDDDEVRATQPIQHSRTQPKDAHQGQTSEENIPSGEVLKTPITDNEKSSASDEIKINARADLPARVDHVTNTEPSFRERLMTFVGGYAIQSDFGSNPEEAQENTMRVVSSIMLTRNLTDEQIAAILCVLLCG